MSTYRERASHKSERHGVVRSFSRERLVDPDYRRKTALYALAGLEQWCEHYQGMAELEPVIDAVRGCYEGILERKA